MKLLLFAFICCLTILDSSGQVIIYDMKVTGSEPPASTVCISSCNECGKLIFTSSLSDLIFISDLNNIVGKPEINRRINDDGNEVFTYKVSVKALPNQQIRIRGPIVKDFILTVNELLVGQCLYFMINPITDDVVSRGSLFLKSVPSSAKITLDGEKSLTGVVTNYLVTNYPVGTYKVKIEKENYFPVDTTLTILPNKPNQIEEVTFYLKPLQGIKKIDVQKKNDIKIDYQSEINKHARNQKIWGISALGAAGAGVGMLIAASKKYEEYQNATSSTASDLYNTSKLYDNIGYGLMGVSGVCAVGFVVQTSKKSKAKKQLKVSTNGASAMVTYSF
jgi:hypothetical protein